MKYSMESSRLVKRLNSAKEAISASPKLPSVISQIGINMVDLMMWLVIAALLLAAALQGIGYYQQAAWTYQAKSDISSIRTFMEAQYSINGKYPAIIASDSAGLKAGGFDLKLSGTNKVATARTPVNTVGWTATLMSGDLYQSGNPNSFFNFGSKDDPATTTYDESTNTIPATSVQGQTMVSN